MADSIRTLDTLELIGGALCLDFVNTINSRLYPEHDYLEQYSDLLGWANKVGILSPAQMNRIQKRAKQNTGTAEEVQEYALQLRELLYRLFSNTAKGSEPSRKDMDTFIVYYGETIAESQLLEDDSHYTLTWNVDRSLDGLLDPVIHAAGELLLHGDLNQVKECPGCGWLFLDTSKNQSRRWCSMNTCGARDKMRRYHGKQRTK